MYAERGEKISKVMAEKRAKGEPAGRIPIGYRIAVDPDGTRRVEIDPDTAPLVQAAFEMAAHGEYSLRKIAAHLAAHGLCRPDGRPLAATTVHWLLHNPAYVGNADSSSAIMEAKMFHLVQGALAARWRAHVEHPII